MVEINGYLRPHTKCKDKQKQKEQRKSKTEKEKRQSEVFLNEWKMMMFCLVTF